MTTINRRQTLALGSSAFLLPSFAHAQATWPAGPVTFVSATAQAAAPISMPASSET
jgi:hypothetical protein